ncbi:MAG: PAN/Apple domain-containing protein, partial [Hyphomicrobiales bacterium]|nr:PAN/Apple domain-containing protein [Hyphomicrobiales bacterium]
MNRILGTLLTLIFVSALAPSAVTAEEGQRRIVVSKDADYFGGDYSILQNVTLAACERACLDDNQCRAFTYNVSASWCFLKNSVGELRSVVGAVSGQVVEAAATDPNLQAKRREELTFIPQRQLDEADQQIGEIQRRKPSEASALVLVSSGYAAMKNKDPGSAANLFRDTIALDEAQFDHWRALIRAHYAIRADGWQERQALGR